MQAEKKKAGPGDDSHGNPEIERLRKEVQDTKEINRKLRELVQVFLKTCILVVVINRQAAFIYLSMQRVHSSVQ